MVGGMPVGGLQRIAAGTCSPSWPSPAQVRRLPSMIRSACDMVDLRVVLVDCAVARERVGAFR